MQKKGLHPALRREGRLTLRDIYYSKEKIEGWKEKCIKKQKEVTEKLSHYMEAILLIKESIKVIKKKFLKENKDAFHHSVSELRRTHQLADQNSKLILRTVHSAYSLHRANLHSFAKDNFSSREEGVEKLFESQAELEQVLESGVRQKEELEGYIGELGAAYRRFERVRGRMEEDYYTLRKDVASRSGSLGSLGSKLETLVKTESRKVNEDFEFLRKPLSMSEAYEKSLTEISRRRWFYDQYYPIFEEMKQHFASENNLRENFHRRFGDVLPVTFVPELKNLLPDLAQFNSFELDRGLPPIKGYHSDQDVLLTLKPGGEQGKKEPDPGLLSLLEELKKKLQEREDQLDLLRTEKLTLSQSLASANQKLTAQKYLAKQTEEVDFAEFKMLLRNSTLPQSRVRSLFKNVLGCQARSLYDYFSPMLVSRNQELTDEKIRNMKLKKELEGVLAEKEKEFKAKIEEFHREIDELHRRLRSQRQLNLERDQDLQEIRAAVSEEKRSWASAIDQKNVRVYKLERELEELRAEAAERRTDSEGVELEEYREEVGRLEGELREQEREVRRLKEELKKSKIERFLQENNPVISAQLSPRNLFSSPDHTNPHAHAERRSIQEVEQKRDAAIQLTFKIEEKERVIFEQEKKLEQLRGTLSRRERELQDLREETRKAKTQTRNVQEELQRVKRDLQSTRNLPQALFSDSPQKHLSSGNSNQFQSSHGEASLRRRLTDCEDELKQKESRYNNMKNLLNCADEEVQKMKAKLKQREDELFELRVKIEQNEHQISQLAGEKRDLLSQKEELVREQRNRVEELTQELEVVRKEKESIREEKRKLENELADLRRSVEARLQRVYAEARAKEADLERELKAAENEILRARDELDSGESREAQLAELSKAFFRKEAKGDQLRVGHFGIFVQLHASVYIPLVLKGMEIKEGEHEFENLEGGLTLDEVQDYLEFLDRRNEGSLSGSKFSAFLDLRDSGHSICESFIDGKSLPKLLMAKVTRIQRTQLDFEENRHFVSFVEEGREFWKVETETPALVWEGI